MDIIGTDVMECKKFNFSDLMQSQIRGQIMTELIFRMKIGQNLTEI